MDFPLRRPNDSIARLRSAIDSLPEPLHQVATVAVLRGGSLIEIANALQVSEAEAAELWTRTRDELRARMPRTQT